VVNRALEFFSIETGFEAHGVPLVRDPEFA
jgi:hypothetical protein